MTASKIEWTDRSDWNPIRGCTRVSPGCGGPGKHGGCYAEAMAARFSKPGQWGHGVAEMRNGSPHWTGKVELQEDRVTLPLRWKKPARIFVSSTSDVFHEALPDAAIDKLFAIMALCPQHIFQILTKRAERMRDYCLGADRYGVARSPISVIELQRAWPDALSSPLPNVWLGVSCEDQQRADKRIPLLLQTPAAVRFISAEPLLGPIDLTELYPLPDSENAMNALAGIRANPDGTASFGPGLDWVITGGESGPHARPAHVDWFRSLRDQCASADVAYFHKQNGEWLTDDGYPGEQHRIGKKAAGRLLDGVEHSAFPVRP